MGKRKPTSILKRQKQQEPRPAKKQKTHQPGSGENKQQDQRQNHKQHAGGGGGGSKWAGGAGGQREPAGLRPTSAVHLQAAYAVRRLLEADTSKRGGVTLKSLTLAPHITAKKATYAVTCETLKHLPVLQQLLEATQLVEQGRGLTQSTALVLGYEALFGEGLRPTGPAERAVLQRKADLAAALQRLLDAAGAAEVGELLPQPGPARPHPRTARVNTLKMSVDAALEWLRQPPMEHRTWAAVGQLAEPDPLLPDLLSFPPGTDLHDHPLVASGSLILQSKASCMPAHALAPQPGWEVVDACAAPGNKTTHLAALMGNRGSIHAFEKDGKRVERLRHNAAFTGGTIISACHADFLTVDPESPEFAGVRAVLLDPSCSGSGTAFSRMDFLLPSSADRLKGQAAVEHSDERVEALAQFQQTAILHALRFPALQRLVYSTCSVHARENEDVVAAVLPEARARGLELEAVFPSWQRRGVAGRVEGAEKLVRVDPDEDGTDGFFVALFAKAGSGSGSTWAGGGVSTKSSGAERTGAAAAAAGKQQQQQQQKGKKRRKQQQQEQL